MSFIKIKLGLVSSVVLLSGCSIGQSEFTCSLGSENSVCASSRAVYKATNGELAENETITYVEDGETKQITVSELQAIQSGEALGGDNELGSKKTETQNTSNSHHYWSPKNGPRGLTQKSSKKTPPQKVKKDVVKVEPNIPYQFGFDGDAIRTPVTVMRIWVAPFVDQQDNLRMSQVLFTDMEKKSWKIADIQPQNFGVRTTAVIHKSNKLEAAKSEPLETEKKDGSMYIDPASLQQISTNFTK